MIQQWRLFFILFTFALNLPMPSIIVDQLNPGDQFIGFNETRCISIHIQRENVEL